jgi:hypothetical protein
MAGIAVAYSPAFSTLARSRAAPRRGSTPKGSRFVPWRVCNSHTAWMTQGGPQDPSDTQLQAIKDRQGLELLEPERGEAIQDGSLVLRIPFPLPSVSLIEIRPLS